MRLSQVFLVVSQLLFANANQGPSFQIQSDLSSSLTSQDWTSIINARPVGLGSSAAEDEVEAEAEAKADAKIVPEFVEAEDLAATESVPLIPVDELHRSRLQPLIGAFHGFINYVVNLAFARPSTFPHSLWGGYHHREPVDLKKYTIGEILDWVLHHPDKSNEHQKSFPLRRLAWLVNQSEPIQKILRNPEADLTFFAPDDEALTPPHKRGHRGWGHGPRGPNAITDMPVEQPVDHVFWQVLAAGCPHSHQAHVDDEDDDKKEKRKKFLLHLLEAVLKYHVSPGKKSIKDILDHSTLASALHIEPNSSPVFRIRVGGPPHFTKPGATALNFFTEIGTYGPHHQTILAKNGVIHLAHGFPLVPPFSVLSQLFLYPKAFSTLTSALQKVKLDDILLPSWENKTVPLETTEDDLDVVDERVESLLSSIVLDHEHKFHKRSFTVFAPTNRAFRALGPHLNAFLFSPFGYHALHYVLSYHIVPDIIFYTDHVDKTADGASIIAGEERGIDFFSRLVEDSDPTLFATRDFPEAPHGHPHVPLHPPHIPWKHANVTHFCLPTLLGSAKNESLAVALVKYHLPGSEPKRQLFVKQAPLPPSKSGSPDKKPRKPIRVVIADGVAWGGAIHVIPNLIHPPIPSSAHPHHHAIQHLFSNTEKLEGLFI
ncbi:hypothetical protein CROQUDRAFT_670368 [Cronartium quercuum f. sp. fusiforme G11]|uniref:FAS1 domain-containing protein n=1 Tax=Cronartium quercuum f. sp. fusiforme G11 TaxID=708437 RepID=A0A9P6TCY1_9BASI|nr:hypothetical protein CROQUDRAFT_670368 [Cronartium quercuum f. sp. fusiforme G11]